MKKKFISYKTMKWGLLLLTLCLSGFSMQTAAETYDWNTVRVGGGGATTSMQAHPKVQNLYFITTDVGTPYRWNHSLQRWEGVFYNLPTGYWGKNAAANIAFDPSDNTGNVLYATIGGAWTTGAILKSTDRGDTWIDCQLPLDVEPNKSQRFGQRLAVDPQNSDVVYITTRPASGVTSKNGTFKSSSAGAIASWTKLSELCGAFVAFDISSGTISGVTKTIYLGCADGVYRSDNGGSSFSLMVGSPKDIYRGVIHKDGTLYVTHNIGVAKWNGIAWSNITPPYAKSYQAVDVNPNNSDQVIVGADRQFVSKDGGNTWTGITPVKDISEIPWFSPTIGGGLADFCWDPYDQNMVWFTDFFDAQQTTNIWAGGAVTWKARAVGHEETCATGNLLCPPSGVNLLLSNVADVGGWDHKSINEAPSVGMVSLFPWTFSGECGNMTGVAIQETNPNFIARVGSHGWSGLGYAGYSTDGGATYTYWNCPADARSGRIAVSANSETMVWVTQLKASYRSTDRGLNWTMISTLPTGIIGGGDNFSSGSLFPLAADKVNGNKFYVYNAGKVYVSTDAGATFAASAASLPNMYFVGNLTLETTQGKEGDIWLGMRESGLYHSTNSGTSFTKISSVQKADLIAIGKASPSTPTIPALYVYGTVNNITNSLFRSNDNGATWETISSPTKMGANPYCMGADRNVYGRVFFGTSGNGLFVTTISGSDIQAPTTPSGLSASNITENTTTLTWVASTDNVGVTSYDVYQGGALIGNTATTTFSVTNLSCNKGYSFAVTAKDASGNVSAQSNTVTITTTSCKSIASVTLINADTDVSIQTLAEGATLDLANLPTRHLNIRANTRPSTVGSVVFDLSGAEIRSFTENTTPYAFYGKVGADYNPWTPKSGNYILTVTPYEGLDGAGAKGTSLTRNFTVTDSNPPDGIEDVPSNGLSVVVSSPIFGNKLTVRLKGYQGESSVKLVMNDISGRIVHNEVIQTEGLSEQVVQIGAANLNKGLFIMSVISKNAKKDIKVLIN